MRFILKGHRSHGVPVVPEFYDTEEAAKGRAFELLHNEGSGITVEIWLEGTHKRLHDSAEMEKEYLEREHATL